MLAPNPMPTIRSARFDRLLGIALALLAPVAMLFILAHVLWGFLVAGLLFPLLPARTSNALVQFWSRVLLLVLGLRLELHLDARAGAIAATRGSLLVINHISWVDVFVIAAVTPARFVAKAEIARWPLLGRFARAVGTVFVERRRHHAVAHVNHAVTARLRAGQSIGIFPEGTTTDGSQLLRFHANLVQPAIDARAPVIPLALQYRQDGMPTRAAAFIGEMNLIESMWRILVTPRLTAQLHWLPALDGKQDNRHAIARRARAAIGAALVLVDQESYRQEPAARVGEVLDSAPVNGG